jgi:hypothetical protein
MQMIGKVLTLAGGLAGAAGLSQYPEFSQQYIQRLGGQVDALSVIVADFDRSATDNNLTREAALDQLQGTAFLAARKVDMQNAFARFDRLSADLTFLRLATPIERIAMPHRLADTETFNATWADFRPAVPLTAAGAVATGVGFVAGWGVLSLLLGLVLWPFRRVKTPRKPAQTQPQTLRQAPVVRSQAPAPEPEPAPAPKPAQKLLVAQRPTAAPKPAATPKPAARKQPVLRRPAQ